MPIVEYEDGEVGVEYTIPEEIRVQITDKVLEDIKKYIPISFKKEYTEEELIRNDNDDE